MKRKACILAVALFFALLFGADPISAADSYTVYAVEGGNLYFDPETGTVVDCDTSVTSAEIPAEIDGVAVTSLGQLAFYNCTKLTAVSTASDVISIKAGAFRYCDALSDVKFAGTVTEIGNYAFDFCYALTSLNIHCSDMTIGKYAFQYCSALSEVTFDGTVKSFAEGAFYCCTALTSAQIPEGVTSLGNYAFGGCSKLTEVHLPASLETMGTDVFGACSRIERFTVAEGNTSFSVDECGVLYNADKTELIEYPTGSAMTEYTVCAGVTSIPDSAFDTVEALEYVTLPEGVTSIGQYAFHQCYALKSISIPSTLQSIGGDAFTNCHSLLEIDLPEGLTEIGEQAFSSCYGLYSVTIPGTVRSISRSAFHGCSGLVALELEEGVEEIRASAFRNCTSLSYVDFPASLRSIGTSSFRACPRLANLTFPEGLVSIGEDAFCFCYSLSFVILPETLTDIGSCAFQTCTSLKAASVPANVTSIGYDAFSGCDALTIYGESGSYAETYATENGIPFSTGGVVAISGYVLTPRGEPVSGVWIDLVNTADGTYYCADVTDEYGYWCVPFARIGETYEVCYSHVDYPDNGLEYVYTIGDQPVRAESIYVVKTGFARSGSHQIEKLSQTELNYLMARKYIYVKDDIYSTEPSLSQPYSSGVLSEEQLDLALERLNDARLIAGLPSVVLFDTYNSYCQDGALISALNGYISHYPKRPSGVDDELYQRAYAVCQQSNLAAHNDSCAYADHGPLGESVDMYLYDTDLSNISKVGHRRWALNPTMGKTGFGCVENGGNYFCTMYAFDTSGSAVDYDFIAWPSSGNYPLEDFFEGDMAWSVTLNPDKFSIPNKSDLTITITEVETGKQCVLSGDQEYPMDFDHRDSEYMNVDYSAVGVSNCIIFRPNSYFVSQGVYTVRIDGLRSRWGRETSLSYYVNLTTINLAESCTEYGMCNYGIEWYRDSNDIFWLGGVSELACNVYLVAYDSTGRLTDISIEWLDLLEGPYPMLVECPDGTLIKLFRTDENGQPASVVWSHQF